MPGLPPGGGSDAPAEMHDEVARRLARARFVSFDFLCEPVQALLIRLARDMRERDLLELEEFALAIERREFPLAAELLESRCTKTPRKMPNCDYDVAILMARCPVAAAWSEPPTWSATGYTQSSSEGDGLEVVVVRVESESNSVVAGKTWQEVTLELDLALTVHGLAACSSTVGVQLTARLVQKAVRLTLFSEARATDAQARGIASELYIRPDGMLAPRRTVASHWWSQHSSLFVDAAAINDLRGRARDVCVSGGAYAAAPSNSSVTLSLDMELSLDGSEPLVERAQSPAAQTLVMAGLSQRSWPVRRAPLAVCQARCAPGLTPTALSATASSLPVRFHGAFENNSGTIFCFEYLWRDYATCSMDKALADSRFGQCLSLQLATKLSQGTNFRQDDRPDSGVPWAARVLRATNAPAKVITAVLTLLDCETFTDTKAQHCTCLQGAPHPADSLRSLEGDVGRVFDPTADSRPADRTSVRERLWGLGYGQDSFSLATPTDSCEDDIGQPSTSGGPGFVSVDLQDHLSRVFLCAAVGVFAFEDQCDVQRVNGNCAVDGIECPRPARTSRQTCLRLDIPCAHGSIRVGSSEHDWLRSSAAPRWVGLPHSGDGYLVEQGSTPFAFGTSWLAWALEMAGRYAKQATEQPLRVLTASGREGGKLPDMEGHQTGLQIIFMLPVVSGKGKGDTIDWEAVQTHVSALQLAGFEDIEIKGKGESGTCKWKPDLCRGSRARLGQMNALLNPASLPSLPLLPKLPHLTGATIERASDGQSATLRVMGRSLGTDLEDVMEVAVGAHRCVPTSLLPDGEAHQSLTAQCSSPSLVGLLRGLASATTASGGQGIGTVFLDVLLNPEHPPLPPPPPPSPPVTWEHPAGRSYTPPVVVVPGDISGVGMVHPLESPVTISALRELQASLHGGGLPRCNAPVPSAPPPSVGQAAQTANVDVPPSVPPYPSTGALLQTYPPQSALMVPSEREYSPLSGAGNCSINVAHQVFDACSARLMQPLFPIADDDAWAIQLLLNARPELGAGSASLGSTFASPSGGWSASRAPTRSCPTDDTFFSGNVSVPGQAIAIPYTAGLPRAGGPTDPESGLPLGLLIEVGAFTMQGGLGLGASAQLRLSLTTVAFGRVAEMIAACSGGSTPQHRAMMEVWASSTDADLHMLLNAALSFRLPAASAIPTYDDLATLTAPLKVTFVEGDRIPAEDERALSVPLHLRGKAAGMHLSATTKLQAGPPRGLGCMLAWLAEDAHPCVPQPVRVDLFFPATTSVPAEGRLSAILSGAHLTAVLNTTRSSDASSGSRSLGPYFLASIGQATLRVDDLRPVEFNVYSERVTQLPSLTLDQLAVRLPVYADCSLSTDHRFTGGWTAPIVLNGIVAEHFTSTVSEAQMIGLQAIYPTGIRQKPNTQDLDPTHEFVRLGRLQPPRIFRPLTLQSGGQTWPHPLGTDLALDSVTLDVIYTVVHPVPALEGPSMHASGQVALTSGTLLDLTVQIDRGYAIGDESLLAAPTRDTGLYLLPPLLPGNRPRTGLDHLAYMDGMEAIDLFLKAGSLPAATSGAMPEAVIRQVTLDADLVACLAGNNTWFHPYGQGTPASFPCAAGFHLTATGSAWGGQAQIRVDANLANFTKGFVFEDHLMHVQMTHPNDLAASVKTGVGSVVGGSTFIEGCTLSNAAAAFSLTQSQSVALDIDADCTHHSFLISMRLGLDFGASDSTSVSASVQRAWPLRMALDVHADLDVSLHDVAALFLSAYLPADQRAQALGSGLSPGFRFISASDMRGCIAGSDVPGYCSGGVHASMRIGASGGFFGVEADAYVSSPRYNASAGIGPLKLDVVVKSSALAQLWTSVYSGILDAVGGEQWAGTIAFLERVTLASIRLEHTTDPADTTGGSLIILLNDRVRCGKQVNLTLPLSLFHEHLWAEQAWTASQLEEVLGELSVEKLLGALSNDLQDLAALVTDGLSFNATVEIPVIIAAEWAAAGGMEPFIADADICQLGVMVEYLEIAPPAVPSELCAAVWQWRERAELLRAGLAANASCGAHFATWELGQLRQFEERLGALQPAHTLAACLQASSFLAGVRSAIELPSESLRRNLNALERVLEGLEAAWAAGSGSTQLAAAEAAQEEVLLLVPSAVERMRQMVSWRPVARRLADSVRRVNGVLDVDNVTDPGAVMGQLQQWGSTLQSVIDVLPQDVPDVDTVFQSMKLQADKIVRKIGDVDGSLATTMSLVEQAESALRPLEQLVSILNPESVEKAKMNELSKIDFRKVYTLLNTARDYLLDNRNLLRTMAEHRTRVDDTACATSVNGDGCDIQGVLGVVAAMREMLSPRPGGARQVLNDFPPLITEHLASLSHQLQEGFKHLFECCVVLSDLVNRMPSYMDAIDEMISGPTHRVDLVAKAFFSHIDAMEAALDDTLEAINHLRDGQAVTDALQAAAASLTTAKHGALMKQAAKCVLFFGGFSERLLPEAFKTLVPFILTVLVPAAETVKQLERYLVRKRYLDHLLSLPTDFLTQVLSFDNRRDSTQQLASVVPSAPAVEKTTQLLFDELPSIEEDLSDLLLPNSTCLATASCQADLQLKVRKVRGTARALQRKIRPLSTLATSLREPLLATVDLMSIVRTVQPDLELMSAWTTQTNGPIPAENTSSSIVQPIVLRQLTGALCKELSLRSLQGRSAVAPFDLELPCSEMGRGYEDAPNAMAISVEQTAESWTLWQKLASTMHFLVGELSIHRDAMRQHLVDASDEQKAFQEPSESFAISFNDMLLQFGLAFYYQANMSIVFTLEAAIVSAEFDTKASMSIWEMRDLSGSCGATLRRMSGATSDPWTCTEAPQYCSQVPPLALDIAASHDELVYDMSTPELTVPVTLLTGCGDAMCDFYGGIMAAHMSLSDLRQPMEDQILKYLQGPAALNKDTPQCKPGDRFCLTTAPRSEFLYRRIFFGLFYLHFWSLGSPAKINPCGQTLKWRFTIPGLWSAHAMQSSTYLAFNQVIKALIIKCAQFSHLLAYAPAMPGGCTDAYQSFFAGVDKNGQLSMVYPISLPSGQVYAGSLTGLASSPMDNSLWACGREDEDGPWYLYSFDLRPMEFGFGVIEETADGLYPEVPVRMCHRKQLRGDLRVTKGKEKCMLNFDAKKRWLWVGNMAQPGETGQAWGYDLQDVGGGCTTISDYEPRGHMTYGQHVSAFSFLTDLLGDDYVGVGRCDNFNRNTGPCAIEFFDVTRARDSMDLTTKTPGTIIRTPDGIGSLVHDTSLGVAATNGGYFHMSFVGMTPENVDKASEYEADPEDRVFQLRTPFLSTGIRKRVDNIGLSIGGADIIPAGTNIIPNSLIPLKPPEPDCSTVEARQAGCADMGTPASRRRQLSRGHSLSHGRGLLETEGCMDLSVYLIDQQEGGITVNFGLDLGAVGKIKGYFRINPTLVIGMPGAFCMMDMQVKLGLDIKIGIEGAFALEATIAIFRGGLELEGSVLGLEFGPEAVIDLKTMEVKPKLMMAMKLISIAMKAWFEAMTCIKMCCEEVFGVKVCVPCGLKWCGRDSWDFGRITVGGDGRRRDVLKMLMGDYGDKTPPTRGAARITQIDAKKASVRFGNFTETESELASTVLSIFVGSPKGTLLHSERFDGEAESWSGVLKSTPGHGQKVIACAKSTNTWGLFTIVCSELIIWDAMAPVMKHLYTINPFTTNWRIPDCDQNCIFSDPPVPHGRPYHGPKTQPSFPCPVTPTLPCEIFTNVSKSLRFAIRIAGFPAKEPIKSALWSLSEGAPCRSLGCSGAKLVTSFTPIGYPARLAGGTYWVPILEMYAENLALGSGKKYYINMHCCDYFDNCAISGHT